MEEVTVDGTLQSGHLPYALRNEAHTCIFVQIHPESDCLGSKGVGMA